MVACNSHQTTPRSRARDQLSQYFIGLCLKFEILSREPPWELGLVSGSAFAHANRIVREHIDDRQLDQGAHMTTDYNPNLIGFFNLDRLPQHDKGTMTQRVISGEKYSRPDYAAAGRRQRSRRSMARCYRSQASACLSGLESRQPLPTLDRTRFAPANGVARGAYILADADGRDPSVILIGTGSEVALCGEAYESLTREGIAARASLFRMED